MFPIVLGSLPEKRSSVLEWKVASCEAVDDCTDTTRALMEDDTARVYGRGEPVTNWYGSLMCV